MAAFKTRVFCYLLSADTGAGDSAVVLTALRQMNYATQNRWCVKRKVLRGFRVLGGKKGVAVVSWEGLERGKGENREETVFRKVLDENQNLQGEDGRKWKILEE